MCPFCVGRHVGICLNASIASIKTNVKNIFDHTWDAPITTGDQKKNSITNPTTSKILEVSNAPPLNYNVLMAPSQNTSMQSMGSMEMDPLISMNTPLAQIIIPESDTQRILINTLNIQTDPFVNPPNIVVDDLGDITLELGVGPCTITNTRAPQVANPSPSSPKVIRLEKSTKCDSDFDHPQYLKLM
jgi:hypothetical protein